MARSELLEEIVGIGRDIVENKRGRRWNEWLGDKMEAHISRLELALKALDREPMNDQQIRSHQEAKS
jgi:hypothetical protein